MNKLSSPYLVIALLSAQARTQTKDAPPGLEARDWQEIRAAHDRSRHALLEVGVRLAGNPFGDGGLCVGGMTQRMLPFVQAG